MPDKDGQLFYSRDNSFAFFMRYIQFMLTTRIIFNFSARVSAYKFSLKQGNDLWNKLGIKMLMLIGLFYIPQYVLETTTYKLNLFLKRQASILRHQFLWRQ